MTRIFQILFMVFLGLGSANAQESKEQRHLGISPEIAASEESRWVGLTIAEGEVKWVLAEMSTTPAQWRKGLMGRTEMNDDAGMLFDFGTERVISMWMHNTPLSLDMIFINSDGEVVSIARNTVPFSEKIISSNEPARYVLEVKGGMAETWDVNSGSKMFLTAR